MQHRYSVKAEKMSTPMNRARLRRRCLVGLGHVMKAEGPRRESFARGLRPRNMHTALTSFGARCRSRRFGAVPWGLIGVALAPVVGGGTAGVVFKAA